MLVGTRELWGAPGSSRDVLVGSRDTRRNSEEPWKSRQSSQEAQELPGEPRPSSAKPMQYTSESSLGMCRLPFLYIPRRHQPWSSPAKPTQYTHEASLRMGEPSSFIPLQTEQAAA